VARIVLCTLGSLGDLHPYIAVAQALARRGHTPVLATHETYRAKIEALGLAFHAVRPELPGWDHHPELIHRWMDQRHGTERIVREFVMPALHESYADTLAAATAGPVAADLLVSHPLTFTTRLVAETTGIAWASSLLAPLGFLSTTDPSVLPNAEVLARFRGLGPGPLRAVYALGKAMAAPWADPVHKLRAELGLPATRENPLFEGQHSPDLVLALFSHWLAKPQPDWPPRTKVTGFPFFEDETPLSPQLERFLEEGAAPIVFTLGSSAVHAAGAFYEESALVARHLGRRAVLLVGNAPGATPSRDLLTLGYAPYARLFPRAAAIVHQGGVGTTAEAMRSGRPQLIVPFAHDQPDNAERISRRGIGRTLQRSTYSAASAAHTLQEMLADEPLQQRAQEIGSHIRKEDGATTAAVELERRTRRA